ncbi:MAG: pitrilysin family protein [Gammaproteobacteria bacterium]|nr:pitrilysin family protein [Gammaproteobacteria bacterium]
MLSRLRRYLAVMALAALASSPAMAADSLPEIEYQKFTLDNGLTVIISEDKKAPIVAVNVWYHVGSKNEKLGRTGFAHLFEHLMFNGSENAPGEFFGPFDAVGVTSQNGTTNFDRTNYFQNVPKNALDMALWMESDRMGHLLGAVTQDKLDEQRGVVQNEKRQGENQPYGRLFTILLENSFPKGHPYSWSVIGSMEDLDAASLEDVKQWFRDYYGAANATIAVVGDVDTEEALAKVQKYFGDIQAGPPVVRPQAWIAKRDDSRRVVVEDRVPQARFFRSWNAPEMGAMDTDLLDLAAFVLGGGKNSRLYKRLVIDEPLASSASVSMSEFEIAGLFYVDVTLNPGVDMAKVEKIVEAELAKFLREGPTDEELERVIAEQRAAYLRRLENIDGFGGKSNILAAAEVYLGAPDAYLEKYRRFERATDDMVRNAARRWLSSGDLTLEYRPYPKYSTTPSTVDRSKGIPATGPDPEVSFPTVEKAVLDNGLTVLLTRREGAPVVEMSLQVNAGYSSDSKDKAGNAKLAMSMLDEGTADMDALEISEALALLGAQLSAGSNLDMSYLNMSALRGKLDDSLELFADVALNPAFPAKDFERVKQQQVVGIQREKNSPVNMALRVFPVLLYSDDHPYAIPYTGSGFEGTVSTLTRADMRAWHSTWFRPNNATMVVAGDISMDALKRQLEDLFGDWEAAEVPGKTLADVALPEKSKVYLIDRPDSVQSMIIGGHLVPSNGNERNLAFEAANEVLGGSFSARVNMNLREDKSWAYGAYAVLPDARGQRPMFLYAPVQSDKTSESMVELMKEFRGIDGKKPATPAELTRAKDESTKTLPGRWETTSDLLRDTIELVRFDLPLDHWDGYADEVRSLNLQQVNSAAQDFLHPDRMVWVVVGDLEQIEAGIRKLGFGEIVILDADGNVVE